VINLLFRSAAQKRVPEKAGRGVGFLRGVLFQGIWAGALVVGGGKKAWRRAQEKTGAFKVADPPGGRRARGGRPAFVTASGSRRRANLQKGKPKPGCRLEISLHPRGGPGKMSPRLTPGGQKGRSGTHAGDPLFPGAWFGPLRPQFAQGGAQPIRIFKIGGRGNFIGSPDLLSWYVCSGANSGP